MEIKVYFNDGLIESHTIPEYAGKVFCDTDEKRHRDVTTSNADDIADIFERVRANDEGVLFERAINIRSSHDAWVQEGIRYANGTKGMYVVPKQRMQDVRRVCVDGEQVWPEPEDEDIAAAIERLERVMHGMSE